MERRIAEIPASRVGRHQRRPHPARDGHRVPRPRLPGAAPGALHRRQRQRPVAAGVRRGRPPRALPGSHRTARRPHREAGIAPAGAVGARPDRAALRARRRGGGDGPFAPCPEDHRREGRAPGASQPARLGQPRRDRRVHGREQAHPRLLDGGAAPAGAITPISPAATPNGASTTCWSPGGAPTRQYRAWAARTGRTKRRRHCSAPWPPTSRGSGGSSPRSRAGSTASVRSRAASAIRRPPWAATRRSSARATTWRACTPRRRSASSTWPSIEAPSRAGPSPTSRRRPASSSSTRARSRRTCLRCRGFLNRLLALPIAEQNQLFGALEERIEANIEQAIEAGSYEVGVETVRADSLSTAGRETLYEHPRTGAVTDLVEIVPPATGWNRRPPRPRWGCAPATPAPTECRHWWSTRARSAPPSCCRRPRACSTMAGCRSACASSGPRPATPWRKPELDASNWRPADEATWGALWEHEIAELPTHRESRFWLAAGLLLPIWDRLPFENMRVRRLTTDAGEALIRPRARRRSR